ncbi:MAG TPA: cytochrome c peroxidase [Polyangiaceae bacterium]|nr:cytochrome c peroxidase [Polyangiaceae bacterium]
MALDDPDPQLSEAELGKLRELSPAELPGPVADPTNAWADDAAAATFGQALFFDARFSGKLLDGDNDGSEFALGRKGDTGKVSCAGCHVPEHDFSDTRTLGRQISLGAGWGIRRSPSLLDVGQSKLLMWDGRRDALFNQPFGVLESEVEMNSSRLYAAAQVFDNYKPTYEAIFGALPPLDDQARFPRLSAADTGCASLDKDNKCTGKKRGTPGDGAEFDALSTDDQDAITRVWVNVGKALGAYERKLSCGSAAFDAWVNGDDGAIGRAEQRGAGLFVGKAGCVNCHSGPYLSDEKFHNVGLRPGLVAAVFTDLNDQGAALGLAQAKADPLNSLGDFSDGHDSRLADDVGPQDAGAFRTPRLRCVAERPSFMHTGHVRSLAEVIDFFDRGGEQGGFPGQNELKPLNLTARERADLLAFLQTLTGSGPPAALLRAP